MQATMFSKILCLYISLVLIATNTRGVCSKKSKSNDLRSPINIDTSKVVPVTPEIPLQIVYEAHSLDIVKNTGEAILFYPLPFTRTRITGGLLPSNTTYKLHRNFLNINQNPKGRSGGTTNGKAYPVIGNNVFFNLFYGTYENATEHDDGLVVISEPVRVISKPNPDFEPFGEILRSGKLREPNSTTVIQTQNVYNWYTSLAKNHAYYAYQGSFKDPETKKLIPIVIRVVTQPPYNHISYEQHEELKNILGKNGKAIETISPIYPRRNRTVQASNEFQRSTFPFGGVVFLLEAAYIFFFGTSI